MSTGHARLAPSNPRWVYCPGSVREEAKYPDISGDAAVDGTGSHLLLESCLTHNVRADAYEGQVIGIGHEDKPEGWMINQDRVERVQICLDYIRARAKQLQGFYPGCKVKVEAEVQTNPGGMYGREDWWGTVDITLTVTNDHGRCVFMEIIDYKDGRTWVSEKDNTQLISYLLGKLRPYIAQGINLNEAVDATRIGNPCMVTICQPKTEKVIRSDTIDPIELNSWGQFLLGAAIATDDPKAPLVPDNKGGKGYCKWCKHKDNCTALGERDLEGLTTMTSVIEQEGSHDIGTLGSQLMADPESMPVDQLCKIADLKPGIMAIFDMAEKEIERRVNEGEHVPGWAMLPGKGKNTWNEDEDVIVEALKGKRVKQEIYYPKVLISPTQFMKNTAITKKKRDDIAEKYITFMAGKTTLQRVQEEDTKDSKDLFGAAPALDFSKPSKLSFI